MTTGELQALLRLLAEWEGEELELVMQERREAERQGRLHSENSTLRLRDDRPQEAVWQSSGQSDTAKCYAPPNCSIAEITGGIRAAARIKIPIRKALNVLLIVTSLTMTNNEHDCLSVRLVHIRRKARGYRPPKCLATRSAALTVRDCAVAVATLKKDPMTQHIQPCKGAQSGGQTAHQNQRVKMLSHSATPDPAWKPTSDRPNQCGEPLTR
jgi:hypothetical protein